MSLTNELQRADRTHLVFVLAVQALQQVYLKGQKT
jgi:hypothetical protein